MYTPPPTWIDFFKKVTKFYELVYYINSTCLMFKPTNYGTKMFFFSLFTARLQK